MHEMRKVGKDDNSAGSEKEMKLGYPDGPAAIIHPLKVAPNGRILESKIEKYIHSIPGCKLYTEEQAIQYAKFVARQLVLGFIPCTHSNVRQIEHDLEMLLKENEDETCRNH
jgi:hypothetical protein